jgi:CHAT domain-containing protein
VLGRAPDGSAAHDGVGDPAQVRAWLEDPQGGALLHLACHATVSAERGAAHTSYLLLAGGQRLSAEDLVDSLGGPTGHSLALTVLAACRTNESGRGYDEAFSLATAFLVHGTRSVISTQWSVPDAGAPLLMFMFYHFLCARGLRPADALREAQLWTIRRDALPDDAPAGIRTLRNDHPHSDMRVWGAFTHSGR